jgi:hypothetical protein
VIGFVENEERHESRYLVDHDLSVGRAEDVLWWLQRPRLGLSHGCSEAVSPTDVLKSVYLPNQPVFGSRFPNLGQAETLIALLQLLRRGKMCKWLHAHVHGITELYLRRVCLLAINNK